MGRAAIAMAAVCRGTRYALAEITDYSKLCPPTDATQWRPYPHSPAVMSSMWSWKRAWALSA